MSVLNFYLYKDVLTSINLYCLVLYNCNKYWILLQLAWHPVMENILAFGTGEGRVGLLDLSGNRQPTLLRLYHRKCVYSLIWAPPVILGEGK